jgi:YVTN family beta-propeller protein
MADGQILVAGGAVQAGNGLYLAREADRQLLALCLAGEFAFVLTSRQMGKSSLVFRTIEQLVEHDVRPAFLDLTEMGSMVDAEQWYRGVVLAIGEQLELPVAEIRQWWTSVADLPMGQRFTTFFQDVVMARIPQRVVIFIDEIDTTLRLDFTDDFFTGIRFLYHARATNPAMVRLSFVLSGVATPLDLVKDRDRTPFNIGTAVELTDFTEAEALPIFEAMHVPKAAAPAVMRAILLQTGGHPYLTLRTARSLAEEPPDSWTDDAVVARVERLFYGRGSERDSNLALVRDMLTKNARQPEATLRLYRDIRRGRVVMDQELDQVRNWLKLSGVVVRREGRLEVRNPIYAHVFDVDWTNRHLSLYVNWKRRLTRAAAAVVVVMLFALIPLAIWAEVNRRAAVRDAAAAREQAGIAMTEREAAEAARRAADTARMDATAARDQAVKSALLAESLRAGAVRDRQIALDAGARAKNSFLSAQVAQALTALGDSRLATSLPYLLSAAELDPANSAPRDLAFDILAYGGFATPVKEVSTGPPQALPAEIQFNRDGSRAVLCRSRNCGLFDTNSGKPLSSSESVTYTQTSTTRFGDLVWFTPDGTSLVSIEGSRLNVRDAASLRVKSGVPLPQADAKLAAGRNRVAAISSTTATVVDYKSGSTLRLIQIDSRSNRPLTTTGALSDDDSMLAVATADAQPLEQRQDPGSLSVYDLSGTAPPETFVLLERNPILRWRPGAKDLAIGYRNGTIELLKDKTTERQTVNHGAAVTHLQFSADGHRLLSGGSDRTIKVWDVETGILLGQPIRDSGFDAFAVATDGAIVGGSDGSIRHWRLTPPAAEVHFRSNGIVIFPMSSVDSDRIVASDEKDVLGLWDIRKGRQTGPSFPMPEGRIRMAELSRNGLRFVAVNNDNVSTLWDTATGKSICRIPNATGDFAVRLSPDGRLGALIADDGGIRLVEDCKLRPLVEGLPREKDFFPTFAAGGTRLLVTDDDDDMVHLVDTGTNRVIASAPHVGEIPVFDINVSSQRFLAITAEETAQVFDLLTGSPIGRPLRAGGEIDIAALSPTGERALLAVGSTAQLWEVDGNRAIGVPMNQDGTIKFAGFNRQGTRVFTLSNDQLRVWDAATGWPVTLPVNLSDSRDNFEIGYFSGDGNRVILQNDREVFVRELFPSQPSDVGALRRLIEKRGGLVIGAESIAAPTKQFETRPPGPGRPTPPIVSLTSWLDQASADRPVTPRSEISASRYLSLITGVASEAVEARWRALLR